MKSTIERPRSERGRTGRLHLAVERTVVRGEGLVVRQIARARCVVQGEHQTRATAPDTTCGLDVFRRRLGLTHHRHQAETINVDSDRDHVGRKDDVRCVGIGESSLQGVQFLRDLAGLLARRQLPWIARFPKLASSHGGQRL